MHTLEFSGNANRKRIAAADSTETKEIKMPVSEPSPGELTKISFWIAFAVLRTLQPFIVDAVQVHDFRLQSLRFQNGGKAQYADGRKLANDASCVPFAHGRVKLVGRGRTDEAHFHGGQLIELRMNRRWYTTGWLPPAGDESCQLCGRLLAAHVGDQRILIDPSKLPDLIGGEVEVGQLTNRLRQLVRYSSGQDSGPFSFSYKGSLRHQWFLLRKLTKMHQKCFREYIPEGPDSGMNVYLIVWQVSD